MFTQKYLCLSGDSESSDGVLGRETLDENKPEVFFRDLILVLGGGVVAGSLSGSIPGQALVVVNLVVY
ncbi:MAG: hypothetical protein Q8O64_09565 [Sideroxyarcus sp.]|nr:hypothetical protein [Sideroxyarcus sp.]